MVPSESGLVRRTIWVLRAVAAHPNGVGLSEISRESGIPKATCYRVLNVLERESWLTLDPDTRRYKVSLGLLSIVGGFLDGNAGYRHMRQVISDLAASTQETCGFDVLHPPNVMVVAQAAGPRLIGQTMKPVPRTQPVWATSSGKVLLAKLDRQLFLDGYAEDIEANASRSGGVEKFLLTLDAIRERGYAYTRDELEDGATSVAAPVRVGDTYPYAVWIRRAELPAHAWVDGGRRSAAARGLGELGELLTYTDLRLPADMPV